MKQGESKRKIPIDKHKKESWKKRDAARKPLQEAHATHLADEAAAVDLASFDTNPVTAEEGGQ